MKKANIVLLFLFFSCVAFSQNVATINNKGIPAKEFYWVYKKNHVGSALPTLQELTDYLDLYINFKLKVLDAKALKMDRDTAYLNEIKNYEEIIKSNSRSRLGKDVFQFIMNEYRDGVLMFNISEKKIWNPAKNGVYGSISEADQFALEKEWIEELRNKNSVKINHEELSKLIKL